jgi:iron complex outermembrane receptor protein
LAQLDDNLFAASVGVDYKLSGNLVYANVSRGYKAGGFNIDQRLPATSRAYKPEFNINYELGLKGGAYDGKANLSLTVFYMQRDDAQVSDFVIFNEFVDDGTADGTTRQSFADAVGNAGSGINKGIEVSSTWDINDDWLVVANVGYLDATLSEYTQSNGNIIPLQEQAQAPKYTGYLSSSYRINEQFSWFVDLDVKDDHRFSDGHEERSPFTAVVNSELAWDAHPFQIKVWVKNMFDRKVFTRGFGGFSNDPRADYAVPEPYYQFGQARQVGITFTYTSE